MSEQKKTEKLQKKKNIRFLCIFLLFSLSVSFFAVLYDFCRCRSEKIAYHVSLFGEDLSGVSFEQARCIIDSNIKERGAETITLTYRDQRFDYTCSEMGFPGDGAALWEKAKKLGREGNLFQRYGFRFRSLFKENALEKSVVIREEQLKAVVLLIRDQLRTTARNAYFSIEEDGSITIVPSEKGTFLDADHTERRLRKAMCDPDCSAAALIVAENADPAQTTEDLEAMHIDGMLSSFTTYYSEGAENRAHNIALAVSRLDMTLIRSGEEFSFNGTVGQRSYEQGFRDAVIIENGEYTDGLGGGVCQVSTTVYGAVLRTELEVTARRPHSLASAYVDPGQDAMVSWGTSDLAFRNTYDTPVLLHAVCGGGMLTVSVYGDTREKKEVSVTSEILRYIPFETETILDPDLPSGSQYVRSSGKRGLECSVCRTVSQGGKILKTEVVSHDIYMAQKRIIVSAP